jgi:hypothetical protein
MAEDLTCTSDVDLPDDVSDAQGTEPDRHNRPADPGEVKCAGRRPHAART